MPQDTIWLNEDKTAFTLHENQGDATSSYTLTEQQDEIKFREQREHYSGMAVPIMLVILAVIWIIIKIRFGKSKDWVEIGSAGPLGYDTDTAFQEPVYEQAQAYLQYKGSDLNFSETELVAILNKRSTFYTKLEPSEKDRFIKRLKKFIALKIYNIHDSSGFKEMPVLISASAIQLSFGLENYLLPDFPVINIFPQEFLGLHPNIGFLEGNVSNGAINISWKHFLNGFALPDDGQNVGLHEMAHAYYFQNLQCRDCEDEQFREIYPSYELSANKAYEQELKPGFDLYTEYALRNFQEFWAESIEIFFEKPVQLNTGYPELYTAISNLLKQDPLKMIVSILPDK